jgi:hypothetical protein
VKCVTDFIQVNKLDFVALQETKKETFSNSFFEAVGKSFTWQFIPTLGTTGGILVGLRDMIFELVNWQYFK